MIGGVSINCTATSSQGIMAGAGTVVVNGYGATSGVARVRLATNWLLPAFGPPRMTAVPAPCRGIRRPRTFLPPLFSADHLLLGLGDLRLQFRLKVIGPLVFGDLLHHLLKARQLLFERRRPTILLLGLEILLREIGRHGAGKNVQRFGSDR